MKYPSLIKESDSVEATGHRYIIFSLAIFNFIDFFSSHVTCVKWSNKDDYVYSSGGEDNCIF